ncbi:MAG TPA: nuclear transport factor 2 family protein [Myxococcota bacterium]|nr:nuclear transport factor 2 family protein [Myxococcota bacterium]
MSSLAENKALARRWFALVSANAVDDICAITATSWSMHGGPPQLPKGHAGVRALFQTIGPVEQQWTIDDVIAEDDRVAVRATCNCVQESFLSIPSHGRRQRFSATFVHRIMGGLVQETWRNADDLGRLLQLGARIEAGSP